MSNLKSIVDCIFTKYSDEKELQTENYFSEKFSLEKVIKILYLTDWKHTISYKQQISDIHWKINDFEPLPDKTSLYIIIKLTSQIYINEHKTEKNVEVENNLLKSKKAIQSKKDNNLSTIEIKTIDFVMKWLESKSNKELTHLVYSTYPVISKNNSDSLDLPNIAKKYEEIKLTLNYKDSHST